MAQYQITITVEIDDKAELASEARNRAVIDGGLMVDTWRSMRKEAGDAVKADLIMIFDPGESPAGCSILDSNCERID